jgi:hypothetical protein
MKRGLMVDTAFPYQIVIITQHYSISGGLFLHEQRLSDFLNDKRDSTILLRNVSLARLEEPGKIIEKMPFTVIPKRGMVLVFESPQKVTQTGRQYIKYPKQKYDVFVALDGMEVHGKLNQQGPLDLRQAITNLSESFIPITEAVVTFKVTPDMVLKRDAVLLNAQRIRLMGEVEPQATLDDTQKH